MNCCHATIRTGKTIRRTLFTAVVCGLLALGSPVGPTVAATADETLILVNGEPILPDDIDRMIMAAHTSMDMKGDVNDQLSRLLEKRVNDVLILQDAVAMGLDQDPGFLSVLDEKHEKFAVQTYLRDHFQPPASVSEDSVRAFFNRFYWQIQLRQLSVHTRAGAEELRGLVLAGADMDSLARALSLDTKRMSGGLHNTLYWADVEVVFRNQVIGLEPGEISAVFPFRDAFAFVRVEKRLPVDEEAYSRFETKNRAAIRETDRTRAADAFFAEVLSRVVVSEDLGTLAGIIADSADVLNGTFLKEDDTPVMMVKDGPVLSAGRLRKAISHGAMQEGTASFESHLAKARKSEQRKLALAHAARQAGYFEKPEVVAYYEQQWEEGLIQGYLEEAITSRIVFSRDEFEEFYAQNSEQYRGPDEVRLDMLVLKSETECREAAARLAQGADFGHIWEQYQHSEGGAPGKAKFVKTSLLSLPIQEQLKTMKIGDASEVLEIPMGWLVFVLDEQKEGSAPPIEEMEMGIRQVLFQKEFKNLLDEHLGLMKERSDIRRFPDRIEAYFNPDTEG